MDKLSLRDRLQHGWNAFLNRDKEMPYSFGNVAQNSTSFRPDRVRLTLGNERSIITSVYNRIAIDVASVAIRHVRLDANGRYLEDIDSNLNEVLNVSANVDQTGRALIQDIVMSLFDEGSIAIVATDLTLDPKKGSSWDVQSLRTGKILEWMPTKVRVRVFNEAKGIKEDILVEKKNTAIIENPLYAVMNEPNSTLQRLIRKLNLLDSIDEQSGSGKLDLIIQLPYIIKTPARKAQAEERRKDIEMQLTGSKYGIAYTDGTEKVVQLNRPVENNLMGQITYLTSTLYSQLGMAESIFDGTADERTMLNYFNRTIEPLLSAITDELKRTFLTRTARTQGQSIMFFRDPFKLVPMDQLSESADKFTRNEIVSSNEFRSFLGMKPSKDPKADELRNKNLNVPDTQQPQKGVPQPNEKI